MEPEAPKLISISQLSWTAGWFANLQAKLGDDGPFKLDPNGALTIAETVTQADFNQAASFLWTTRERSVMTIRLINRLMGELILDYAARFRVGWSDAIEALNLGATEKSLSALKKLPRIVSKLSPEILSLEGLNHSHFDVATSFAGPEEPDRIREWNERISDILRQAAECPEDRPSKWVADSVRALQKEFDILPTRPIGGKVLLDQYARINYILEHWTEDQFMAASTTRAKVIDYREDVENQLINRGVMDIPDPNNFVAPWREKPSEEPVIDMEQDVGEQTDGALMEPPDPESEPSNVPTIENQTGKLDAPATPKLFLVEEEDDEELMPLE